MDGLTTGLWNALMQGEAGMASENLLKTFHHLITYLVVFICVYFFENSCHLPR